MSTTENRPCEICHETNGKYICPRCNLLYCSVTCYRGENHRNCSEEFYRNCIQEELLSTDKNNEGTKRMLETLQRFNEPSEEQDIDEEDEEEGSDSESVDDTDDLAARLQGVDLDDAEAVWDKLNENERLDFASKIADESIDIIPTWNPWWMYKMPEKPLIVEIDEDQKEENDETELNFIKKCPPVNENIPPLADSSKVNPAIQFCMENVIYAYALIARFYAGDYLTYLCNEATNNLLQISTTLSHGENFLSHETAIASVNLHALQEVGLTDEQLKIGRDDFIFILEGPGKDEYINLYLLAALSDCIKLLSTSIDKTIKTKYSKGNFAKRFNQNSEVELKWSKKQITLAIKKLEYFLAWAKCK